MLRKHIALLDGVDLGQLHQVASTYYSAQDALNALAQAQERFRAAVATGAFTHDRAQSVLHELEELAESHKDTTCRAFRAFQDHAFAALERGMRPGFRGELIELTARTPSTAHVRDYPAYAYARLDLDLKRWNGPADKTLLLYVSQDIDEYGGPDDSTGRPPSSCRAHAFRSDWPLPQTWDWHVAGL